MVLGRALIMMVATLLVAGCAFDVAYRQPPSTAWEDCAGEECGKGSSVQLREYQATDEAGNAVKGSYMLGFVEFDDQGWYHDRSQQVALFKAIQAYRRDNPETDFLIVTFAHGWQHNAGPDDDNVKEFRKLLERLDVVEQHLAARASQVEGKRDRKARKVVGIYLGWRGASVSVPILENATFWTRKNAGERVGDRSAKQFLMELNEFRAYLNGWKHSDLLAHRDQTQLLLIGHSFGGMLMYHALHTGFMERSIKIEKDGQGSYRYDTAKSFGDFVFLVNPAFEGASYEPLLRAASTRCYADNQRPIMAVITSRGDWATKYAFPIGRFYTIAQSAPLPGERETVFNAVGHLDRYITHDLVYDPQGKAESKTRGLSPTDPRQGQKTLNTVAGALKETRKAGRTETTYDGARLVSRDGLPANFPYLVMYADKEITSGHSDVWNDRLADFMMSFVATEVLRIGREKTDPNAGKPGCVPFGLESLGR